MKRALAVFLVLAALATPAAAVAGGDAYDDMQSHPLRIAAYLLYPVGLLTKWTVAWPIHYVVSQPGLEKVFGHYPHTEYAYDEGYR